MKKCITTYVDDNPRKVTHNFLHWQQTFTLNHHNPHHLFLSFMHVHSTNLIFSSCQYFYIDTANKIETFIDLEILEVM